MSLILFLHGASSGGKTTLAHAIRAQSPTPLIHLSLDHFRDSGAIPREAFRDNRTAAFDGLHRSFAGFADAGCDLIIEHILDTPGWHDSLRHALVAHAVLFVGIHTPKAILEARERQRGDRKIGSAARDHDHIHQGLRYDLTLDGTAPAARNATAVLQAASVARVGDGAFFDAIA